MKASVDVRDLMTLRAAALQVQAKRGASFAPPRPSLAAAPPPRDPNERAVEATDAASPVPASPVPASPVPAPQDLPTDAGPWLDAELPDDLIDQLAGADAWPDAPEPEPQVTSPRRTDPTPPPAVPSSAAPSSAARPTAEPEPDEAFSLPDFTQPAPQDGMAGAQQAMSQLLRDQLRAGAERGRARVTRDTSTTDQS